MLVSNTIFRLLYVNRRKKREIRDDDMMHRFETTLGQMGFNHVFIADSQNRKLISRRLSCYSVFVFKKFCATTFNKNDKELFVQITHRLCFFFFQQKQIYKCDIDDR